MEKLTTLRKENKQSNKNLVSDISEDLRNKSKKLRKEMEKFSRILETEITQSNNVSINRPNSNFSNMNKYQNLKSLSNFKKETLKINTNNENSYIKHFKKINYDPKTAKKLSFFKNSPNKAEDKSQEKQIDLSKTRQFNNTKANKSGLDNNKLFKEKSNFNHLNKHHKIKDLKGIKIF